MTLPLAITAFSSAIAIQLCKMVYVLLNTPSLRPLFLVHFLNSFRYRTNLAEGLLGGRVPMKFAKSLCLARMPPPGFRP